MSGYAEPQANCTPQTMLVFYTFLYVKKVFLSLIISKEDKKGKVGLPISRNYTSQSVSKLSDGNDSRSEIGNQNARNIAKIYILHL